jgi:hypothetical protein
MITWVRKIIFFLLSFENKLNSTFKSWVLEELVNWVIQIKNKCFRTIFKIHR